MSLSLIILTILLNILGGISSKRSCRSSYLNIPLILGILIVADFAIINYIAKDSFPNKFSFFGIINLN